MVDVPITIACGNYDRTEAIRDGRVKVEGCAVTYLPLYPEEIFHRVFKFQEFDISEISFSSYIRTVAAGTSAYIGVPAFVSRIFRHSGIYIRKGAGIEQARRPARQAHRRAGISDHRGGLDARHDAARIRRQAVRDPLAQRRPGTGRAATSARRSSRSPASICRPIGDDKTLVGMLRDGELDALFTARAPSSFLARRAAYRAAVSQHARGRAGLLQEDRHFPDHAPDRHPQDAGREISVAGDQRLQGVLRSQGAGDDRSARRQCADGDLAVARSRDQRDRRDHGRGFLEIRHRGKQAGYRSADAVYLRAGPGRPQGQDRGTVLIRRCSTSRKYERDHGGERQSRHRFRLRPGRRRDDAGAGQEGHSGHADRAIARRRRGSARRHDPCADGGNAGRSWSRKGDVLRRTDGRHGSAAVSFPRPRQRRIDRGVRYQPAQRRSAVSVCGAVGAVQARARRAALYQGERARRGAVSRPSSPG